MNPFSAAIDRTIAAVSPQRAIKRLAARQRLKAYSSLLERAEKNGRALSSGGFSSAEDSRDAHSWLTSSLSPDSNLEEAREDMLERVQSAYKNHELARGFVEGRVARIVGCGLIPDPRIRAVDGEITESQVDELNATLRDAWEIQAEHIGKHGEAFWQLQHLVSRSFDKYGECFLLFGDEFDPLAPTQLKVEVIHPERVETPTNRAGSATTRMGVELDANGREVGAFVRTNHPHDTFDFRERHTFYPSRLPNGLPRLLHIFDKIEDGQHRGYPAMQVGTKRLKNSDEFSEAETERVWAQSCLTAIIRTELGIENAMTAQGAVDSGGKKVQDLSPGQFSYVGPADEVDLLNPSGPASSFDEFQKFQARMFGAGVGVPYEMLSGDWTGTTYSSGKIIVNGDEQTTAIGQKYIGIAVRATWRHFVQRMIATGELAVSQVEYRSRPWNYERLHIIPPKRRSIDPAREQMTELTDIELGALPVQDYIEQRNGRPAREVLRAAQEGRTLLREHEFDEHMPKMNRDQAAGEDPPSRPPTQIGDENPESSKANRNDSAEVAA